MKELSQEHVKTINKALDDFEKSMDIIKPHSDSAYALVIFINSCVDTGKFQHNKFDALVHFQEARKSALILNKLGEENAALFNYAARSAQSIIINSGIINVDLCL